MPVILIPTPLRSYVNHQAEVNVKGDTVGDAFEDLLQRFPAFRPHLSRSDGSPRAFVNLFVNDLNIRDLQGLETPLPPDAIIKLVPSIAGG